MTPRRLLSFAALCGALLLLSSCVRITHLPNPTNFQTVQTVEPPAHEPVAAEPPAPVAPENALIVPPSFTSPPSIRIWLSDASQTPLISCAGSFTMRAGNDTRTFSKTALTVQANPKGLQIGSQVFTVNSVDFAAVGAAKLKVDKHEYPGTVRIARAGPDLAVIIETDLETYLEGVLGSEMPPTWHAEALKAQAVAARSYALYGALARAGQAWHLTSTTEDQVYSGGKYSAPAVAAVRATRGEVLLHEGKVFPAFFHSTCGGMTEFPGRALDKPEYDFLAPVQCDWCRPSPYYRWTTEVGITSLQKALGELANSIGALRTISIVSPTGKGCFLVRIAGDAGQADIPIVDFRRAAGRMIARSCHFDCKLADGNAVFSGRGLGHGAGMCQWGAKGMAEAGNDYRRILAQYYNETSLNKLY